MSNNDGNAYRIKATPQGMQFVLVNGESERSPRKYEEPVIMPRPVTAEPDPDILSRINDALGDGVLGRIARTLAR